MTGFDVRRLEAPVTSELRGMTFPAYQHLLDLQPGVRHPELADRKRVQPIAVAAFDGDVSVGLGLGDLPLSAGEVPGALSLFVRPNHRRLGIAGQLLAALEQIAAGAGFGEIACVYTPGRPEIGYVERLLARRGWEAPTTRTLSVRFRPEAALASSLWDPRTMAVLARDLEIFPWAELAPGEMERMKASNAERRWITPALEPWLFTEEGCLPASVGARHRGEVVGWVLLQSTAPGTVAFSCSSMRKDLSRRGRILPLYRAALERVAGDCVFCTFVTPLSHGGMVRFIQRWIAPIADHVGETRGSRKHLVAVA